MKNINDMTFDELRQTLVEMESEITAETSAMDGWIEKEIDSVEQYIENLVVCDVCCNIIYDNPYKLSVDLIVCQPCKERIL